MTRITTPASQFFLAALVFLCVGMAGMACSDDDDDLLGEQGDDATSEADEGENGDDDDSVDGTDLETSPASGSEYLASYQQIASNLADEFGDECVGAVDFSGLDFADVEVPEECRGYFDEFAGQLDEVEPPDACADLHDLLVNALNSLAEGDDGVVRDLLEGEDGEPSEGIVEATIDCSGI